MAGDEVSTATLSSWTATPGFLLRSSEGKSVLRGQIVAEYRYSLLGSSSPLWRAIILLANRVELEACRRGASHIRRGNTERKV